VRPRTTNRVGHSTIVRALERTQAGHGQTIDWAAQECAELGASLGVTYPRPLLPTARYDVRAIERPPPPSLARGIRSLRIRKVHRSLAGATEVQADSRFGLWTRGWEFIEGNNRDKSDEISCQLFGGTR
jgi:hypothetical protein